MPLLLARSSAVLRVETLECRSSPSLGWTPVTPLDAFPGEDTFSDEPTAGSTALTSDAGATNPVPTTVPQVSSPSSGASAPTSVPLGETTASTISESPDSDFTGGKSFRYDPHGADGRTGGGGNLGQSPVIVNFACNFSSGLWVFSGTVLDDTPVGLTVRFGGAPGSLQGVVAITDGNGNFTKNMTLQSNGADTGTATADTTDPDGNPSNTATVYVDP